jgi:hypothetical protein
VRVRALHLRPLPITALAVTVVLEVAAVVLSAGREPAWDTWIWAVNTIVLGAVGALIASNRPGNPIGWLFLGCAVVNSGLADLAQG